MSRVIPGDGKVSIDELRALNLVYREIEQLKAELSIGGGAVCSGGESAALRARTSDFRSHPLAPRARYSTQCPSAAGPGAKLVRTLTDNTVRRTYSAGTTPVIEKYAKMLGAPRLAPPTHTRLARRSPIDIPPCPHTTPLPVACCISLD